MAVNRIRERIIFFFFNDTATTEIFTLSLHDALPICPGHPRPHQLRTHHPGARRRHAGVHRDGGRHLRDQRSEEHTSELQSHSDLVCRLLLEKKKKKKHTMTTFDALSCSTEKRPDLEG